MAARKSNAPRVTVQHRKGRLPCLYFRDKCGRKVYRSTGTNDASEIERQREELQARLVLGLSVDNPAGGRVASPDMIWEEFREWYRDVVSSHHRNPAENESRLNLAARILKLKGRRVSAFLNRDAMLRLQQALLKGEFSKKGKPRSKFTVNSVTSTILSVYRWAMKNGFVDSVPQIDKLKTAKMKHMKGRPVSGEEFEIMLIKTPAVVGDEAGPSWQFLLRGFWCSGLRLEELMQLHWTDRTKICPAWDTGPHAVLLIPADQQKNDTEDSIPLHPAFEALLRETPAEARTGWAFNPMSLNIRFNRKPRTDRPSAEYVGKVITRIGKAANVVVDAKTGKRASAHDLRRSFIDSLRLAGVPQDIVGTLARHADPRTTERYYQMAETQRDASRLKEALSKMAELSDSASDTDMLNCRKSVHPRGFEPLTFGSVDRCSTVGATSDDCSKSLVLSSFERISDTVHLTAFSILYMVWYRIPAILYQILYHSGSGLACGHLAAWGPAATSFHCREPS